MFRNFKQKLVFIFLLVIFSHLKQHVVRNVDKQRKELKKESTVLSSLSISFAGKTGKRIRNKKKEPQEPRKSKRRELRMTN